MNDKSNGYEAIAREFAATRTASIGPPIVEKWASRLSPGATVLDLGCGNGVPIAQSLLHNGFSVYGVDASRTLISEFQRLFPDAVVECASVEESTFFDRSFDGVVAWGLMFLLPAETQRTLIAKVASVLKQNGAFLFTAPKQACSWTDAMTGLPSISLGHDAYVAELVQNGLTLTGNDEDEGQNYYYFSVKV